MGAYYHTKASVNEYIELAKDVNSRQLIEQMHPFLPSGSTLLELGSGPGTDWQILAETYQVTGSDFSMEFLKRLQSKFPDRDFLQLDARSLATEKKFDGVYSNKVLHHLKDEELAESVTRQVELLNEPGLICHSFWAGEGSEVFKGMFVNYHTEESLRATFEPHFEILLLDPYAEFDDKDSLVLIAKQKGANC
ncbi:MAG: class I SAM-dependent methyltransferase [Bacteroidota bacterium]